MPAQRIRNEQRRSSRACLECRLAKTKCHVQPNKDLCERCERFQFDCKFVRHHRGRKPVSKLAQHAISSADQDDEELSDDSSSSHNNTGPTSLNSHSHSASAAALPNPNTNDTDSRGGLATAGLSAASDRKREKMPQRDEIDSAARKRIWDMLASKIPQRGSTYMFVNKGEVALDGESKSSSSSSAAEAANSSGANTFRNLLRPLSAATAEPGPSEMRFPRLPETITFSGPKDPCDLGILSVSAARRLFDYYFAHLNPWALIFDPALTNHQSIRKSSSFLYTAILFLASRYIDLAPDEPWSYNPESITPAMSARLGSHVRSLAVHAFALADRAMDTAVALYLLSVWKDADDHFSIPYCSYAGKIMSDIPSDLLSAPLPATSSNSETHHRIRRQSQRAFLFHFVQDHAQMLHFAPRPNFDRGPALLRNLLAWSDDEHATQDDVVLCADIDSVLLQTKYKSIMERAQRDSTHAGSECWLLLHAFLDEVEEWSAKWEAQARKIAKRVPVPVPVPVPAAASSTEPSSTLSLPTRLALFKIFRNSVVMQISSIAFRASLRDSSPDSPRTTEIFYTSLEGALNLLHHTSELPPSVLRHSQDLIMILAPHAALLATYLLSLPSQRDRRRRENERRALALIRATRDTFRTATVRTEDSTALCWNYMDSLLAVIEGNTPAHLDDGVAAHTLLHLGSDTSLSPSPAQFSQFAQTPPVDWTWLQSFMELPEFSWM